MIVEVTMSNIVVDSSAVNHGSKHISTGADPIPNATESAGGIVKLGATGVPDAAKVPKALGADLVALITAAGYTLNPAEGTASLDGIADGTTYKRILAAVATTLNAGTFDAATCKAFGIGDVKSLAEGYNIDTLFANGRYSVTRPTITGGGDFSSTGTYTVDVMKTSDGACIQLICRNGSAEFKFRRYDTVSWYTGSIWNALNDGNGGQPPAPKANNTTLNGIGNAKSEFGTIYEGSNANVMSGSGSGFYTTIYISSSGAIVGAWSGYAGAGSYLASGMPAGSTYFKSYWRQE